MVHALLCKWESRVRARALCVCVFLCVCVCVRARPQACTKIKTKRTNIPFSIESTLLLYKLNEQN